MAFWSKNPEKEQGSYALDGFQRAALGGMLVLTILTFIGANLHAVLWQSSKWLVSTVLPSVVVELTNDERAELNEAPLRRNATLDAAAKQKAEHMARNEYFAHFAPDGTSPWYWFDKAGYRYAHAGENLAIHFTDSSEVVEAWMDSPTHRANIVSGKFTEIGVGTAKGSYEGYETVYVVQLFGAPAAAPVVKTSPTQTQSPSAIAATPTPAPATAPATSVPTPVTETVLAESQEATTEEVTALEDDVSTPSEEIVIVPEPTNEVEATINEVADTVVLEKATVATSSGLAVANIFEEPTADDVKALTALATKPNTVLQIAYVLFGFIVIGLLLASVVFEVRHSRYVQAAYGFALLAIMSGLWYVHVLLTHGAVVV